MLTFLKKIFVWWNQETLGTKFDIRDFHDFILENGEVPLTVLEDNYKKWIKNKLIY